MSVRKRFSGKFYKRVAVFLLTAVMTGSMSENIDWTTQYIYAEEENSEPVDEATSEITSTPEEEVTPTVTPEESTPTPEAEVTPTVTPEESTPTPEAEVTPTPKPTKKPTPTPEAEVTPTKKPGKTTPTPEAEVTPTKKPGKTTPTPEAEVTPTKKPGKTTPTPEAEVTPTKKPGKTTPTPTPEISPEVTPEPTPTPDGLSIDGLPIADNNARYQYLLGIDYREITMSTPPEGYETEAAAAKNMTTFSVPVWKINSNGKKYATTYKITINKKLAKSVKAIFKEIYALDIKFPIKVLKGYGYRKVGGVGLTRSTLMSVHSFGAAIDINPGDYDNDYYLGKGNDLRDKSNPYCIPDEVIEIFKKHGWNWGGEFEICSDTMHFQYLGLEFLTYQNNSPFRTVKVKTSYMKGSDVRNLQKRLNDLGFKVAVDGVYGSKTAAAIKKYQKSRKLPVTGEVDYKTWETIINETHYMEYAF